MGELCSDVPVQQSEEAWVETTDVVVQGVDEHPERQIPFEF